MPGVGMGVRGMNDARGLQRRLRQAGAGGLQRELARQLQQAGRPVVLQLRAAALALPAKGPDSTGLRRKIAAATRSAPRIGGVRFYVATGMLGGQASLPQKIHDAAGWWHPVFGRSPYVYQDTPAVPWFTTTVMANEDQLRQACEAAMQRIAAMING
jgi:hypothetical protein